ncbi:MAG: hypothetical protein WA710_19415 [Pseudolabrys sp.]
MPPGVGGGGAGSDGAIGVGAGFGTRFLAFVLLAGFAFFIAFFLRDAPPRFAFLDFFATFNLPNRFNQNYATALAEGNNEQLANALLITAACSACNGP